MKQNCYGFKIEKQFKTETEMYRSFPGSKARKNYRFEFSDTK